MREWFFVFLYGALCLTGLLLSPFWAALARRRRHRIAGRWTLTSDRYYVLAVAISLFAGGNTLVYGMRSFGNLKYGLSHILTDPVESIVIGTGLIVAALGNAALVWLADLEQQPPGWTWTRWLACGTIAWGLVAAVIVALDPIGGL